MLQMQRAMEVCQVNDQMRTAFDTAKLRNASKKDDSLTKVYSQLFVRSATATIVPFHTTVSIYNP